VGLVVLRSVSGAALPEQAVVRQEPKPQRAFNTVLFVVTLDVNLASGQPMVKILARCL